MTPETLVATLRRLLAENLHGPTSLPRPASGVRHSLMGQADRDSAAFEDQSETDLDAQDPRWVALFEELFVNVPHDDSNDDLLFLVRIDYSFGEQVEQGKPTDPILVKRRVPGAGLPVLEPGIQIDWKQTFFLNLIAQIAANLTVAVCTRQYSVILEEKEEANRNSTDPQNATNGTDRLASTSASTSMPIRNNSLTPSDHSGQAIGMVKKTSRGSLLGTDSLLSQKKTDLPKTLPSSRSLSALSVIASNEGESKAEPIGIGKKASQSYFVCGSAPTGTTTTKGIVKPGASKNPFMDLPPSSSTTSTKESRNPFTAPSSGPVNASPMSSTAQTKTTNPASTPTPAPVPKKSSSRMVARQRIVKKVYSAPYKSRMDVKDAFMNECSYPLVYYTVRSVASSLINGYLNLYTN